MTDHDILQFLLIRNPMATQGDVEAFRLFAKGFDIDLETNTPEEVHQKVLASFDTVLEDLEKAETPLERLRAMSRLMWVLEGRDM
jgi:hypothetical protein